MLRGLKIFRGWKVEEGTQPRAGHGQETGAWTLQDGGFPARHGGTPIAGWFMSWRIPYTNGWYWRYTPSFSETPRWYSLLWGFCRKLSCWEQSKVSCRSSRKSFKEWFITFHTFTVVFLQELGRYEQDSRLDVSGPSQKKCQDQSQGFLDVTVPKALLFPNQTYFGVRCTALLPPPWGFRSSRSGTGSF